jgi:hypothetical protein
MPRPLWAITSGKFAHIDALVGGTLAQSLASIEQHHNDIVQ